MLTEEEQELAVEFNEALKKVDKGKWKWEPRRGEFVLRKSLGEVDLIIRILAHGMLRLSSEEGCTFDEPSSKFIPLFHGERVVKILEEMGYIVRVRVEEGFGEECKYNCGIYTNKLGVGTSAPTFQEAVRQATIELAKKEE